MNICLWMNHSQPSLRCANLFWIRNPGQLDINPEV